MSDYTPSGNPVAQSRGTSPSIRAEFQLIATAVNSKPDLDTPNTFTSAQTFSAGIVTVGGTYTGTNDFTGGTINVSTQTVGDSSTKAASTAFVAAASLAAAGIPTQSGNAGKFLTTNGSAASWGTPANGLVLLATLTPTASANIDFLTTFSSTYDNYLIIGDGITVAADDFLRMRLANAGTADSGSNYYAQIQALSTPTTTANTSHQVTSTITSAGVGAGFEIRIINANDASKVKVIHSIGTSQSAATPAFINYYLDGVYNPANSVSGFRLYLNGGSNFGATGKVYVYGYSKT